jgi:hypothetical protein
LGISDRFPRAREIAPVYAVIVMMIYGWTILKFNYNLPGWLYFLNVGEILSILAYSITVNFLESLFVLLGVLVLGFILPRNWFLDRFIACGAGLSVLVLGLMMYIADQFITKESYPAGIIRWSPGILALIGCMVYLIGRISITRKAVEFVADRAIIFLYLTIPASAVSLVAVLLQNLVE